MTRSVVFAGPSIDASAVAEVAPAVELRPPVRRGDIDALLAEPEPPGQIGIVDGQFLQGLMISPKEVLRAIDRRVPVPVFGSSSLGALRAVELAGDGMVGVGQIFELYRTGQVSADDEVAITFDPDTLRPLCEPMVNIRIAIAAAVRNEVIAPEVAAIVIATAKARYFPDRSYRRLLQDLTTADLVSPESLAALRRFLDTEAPDAKKEDALTLLLRMQVR